MMTTYSERMAEFAVDLSLRAIPSEVIAKAKMHILDSLGVAVAAASEPYAGSVVRAIKTWGSRQDSTIIGSAERTAREYAALGNAALVHGIDFDDTHVAAIVHPSSCVVPTALACGEAKNASGAHVLAAIVLGYEIIVRIGLAASGQFHDKGFHATPLCGTFASALVAGKMDGNTAKQMVNALGICGSQGGGIQQFLLDGTWVKTLHPGWAAHAGIVASSLASEGFTGPSAVFEGKLGFFAAYLGLENCRLPLLTSGLGDSWQTLAIAVKPYPSCHFTHSFVDCALHLKEKHNIQWSDIKHIECRISPRGALITCEPMEKKRRVTTSYGGRFSLPYTVAVALVEGIIGLEQFSERSLNDPRIADVAKIVDCVVDEDLAGEHQHFPGDVSIEMHNGNRYRHIQKVERGSLENPIQPEEIIAKFTANMARGGMRNDQKLERIVDMIQHLEDLPTVKELIALLQ